MQNIILNVGGESVEVDSNGLVIDYTQTKTKWPNVKNRVINDLLGMLGDDFSGKIHIQYACPERRNSTQGLLVFPLATSIGDIVDLHVTLIRKSGALARFIENNGLTAGLNVEPETTLPDGYISTPDISANFFQQ